MRAKVGDVIHVEPYVEGLKVTDRLFIEDGLTRVFCAGMETSMVVTDKQYEKMLLNLKMS